MADVTVFGIVDQSVTRTKAGTAAAVTSVAGAYTGNELGFKGSEDLGNGMTADFQIHFAPSVDNAVAPTGYQSHVGVKGAFGGVRIGQFFSPSFFNNATYDTVGYTAFGYNVAAGVNTSGGLKANSIEYTLPTMVTGLSASYVNSQGEAASNVGGLTNYRLNYAVGAFSVGYANGTTKTSTTVNTKDSSVGVSYDLGMAKLAYYGTDSKATGGATTKGSAFGVSVPFGATTLGLQSSTATGGDTGSMVQVKHDLTKRTSAIAQFGRSKISGTTNSGTSIGLWHSF